jgi:hypothetical protein
MISESSSHTRRPAAPDPDFVFTVMGMGSDPAGLA